MPLLLLCGIWLRKLFHKKFNIDYLNVPKANIPLETKELRFKLMEEENLEYLKATKENNLVEGEYEDIDDKDGR